MAAEGEGEETSVLGATLGAVRADLWRAAVRDINTWLDRVSDHIFCLASAPP